MPDKFNLPSLSLLACSCLTHYNMTEEVCTEAMASLATCIAENGGDDSKCGEFMAKLSECCAANNSSTGVCEVNSGA